MVFGKKRPREEEVFSATVADQEPEIQNLDDDSSDEDDLPQVTKETHNYVDVKLKPLLAEVIKGGAASGKNPGGTKNWTCKHCKHLFKSSYTRMHYHFFGAPSGIVPRIRRCEVMLKDRAEYEKLRKIVQDAEKQGVSSSLKSSTLMKREKGSQGSIEDSFKIMDRDMVDMAVERCLCANGLSFNLLRSPYFHEMVSAINKGPKGYKAPSYEKARTTLLDECKRSVEKYLFPVKDTWYTHGLSIVSDGWSNVKKMPLINIPVVNSRGAMFFVC